MADERDMAYSDIVRLRDGEIDAPMYRRRVGPAVDMLGELAGARLLSLLLSLRDSPSVPPIRELALPDDDRLIEYLQQDGPDRSGTTEAQLLRGNPRGVARLMQLMHSFAQTPARSSEGPLPPPNREEIGTLLLREARGRSSSLRRLELAFMPGAVKRPSPKQLDPAASLRTPGDQALRELRDELRETLREIEEIANGMPGRVLRFPPLLDAIEAFEADLARMQQRLRELRQAALEAPGSRPDVPDDTWLPGARVSCGGFRLTFHARSARTIFLDVEREDPLAPAPELTLAVPGQGFELLEPEEYGHYRLTPPSTRSQLLIDDGSTRVLHLQRARA